MVLAYYWVVSCKNLHYHRAKNPFQSHRIPLCVTGEHTSRPELPAHLNVRCDDPGCNHVDRYDEADVIRWYGQTTLLAPHLAFPKTAL